jgi:hypothetical protein
MLFLYGDRLLSCKRSIVIEQATDFNRFFARFVIFAPQLVLRLVQAGGSYSDHLFQWKVAIKISRP